MFTVVKWQLMRLDVTEGCRSEWNDCKGNSTGLSLVGSPNWMPGQGESWIEPPLVMSWMNSVKLNVTLEISNLYTSVWYLLLERFTVWQIQLWCIVLIETVRILMLYWVLILIWIMFVLFAHLFVCYVYFKKWWTMIWWIWKF